VTSSRLLQLRLVVLSRLFGSTEADQRDVEADVTLPRFGFGVVALFAGVRQILPQLPQPFVHTGSFYLAGIADLGKRFTQC
jgi:hypothetical protein